MSKITALKNNIGRIQMEMHPDLGIIVHIDIFDWTKDNFRKSYKIWQKFMRDLDEHGFDTVCAAIQPDDDKLKHFAEMYGFKPTEGKLLLPDTGIEYDVWFYKLGDK